MRWMTRRATCARPSWLAVGNRDPAAVTKVSTEMGVPESLRWVLPQMLARQSSQVMSKDAKEQASKQAPSAPAAAEEEEDAAADSTPPSGSPSNAPPPMSMMQVSEFGRSLPPEMMVGFRV